MINRKEILKLILPLLRNKYVIAGLVFLIWMLFFDQNNIIERVSLNRRISELEQQKEHYQQETKSNRQKMDELQSDPENLEKFAREQFLMKKPDEELFIIKE